MIPAPAESKAEKLYALALRLYPEPFRDSYAIPMRQALRDALGDHAISRRSLLGLFSRDLLTSLFKEHLTMLRATYARPALLFNALILAGIATGIAFALYSIPQHLLRSGANDPQIQLATDTAILLEGGADPSVAVSAANVDIARSLAPFVIAYDDQGRPLASQATLNGSVPVPPAGIFDYVRQHGDERLSWQPILGRTGGVRIAAVVQRVSGSHPGFVLAGRSLREVETRIGDVEKMAGVTWLGMLTLIVVGTAIYGRLTRPELTPIASAR
jgi:hypothetical protein